MRPIIVKLARMLTDCMDAKMGLVRMDESRWETDEQAELMLKMGRRKPTTAAELAKKTGGEEAKIQALLDELADIGLVEYNRHNADRHRQYVVPIFVVGSAENLVLNKPLLEKHPEIAEFFYQMAEEPLKMISHMVPPGRGPHRAGDPQREPVAQYRAAFLLARKVPRSAVDQRLRLPDEHDPARRGLRRAAGQGLHPGGRLRRLPGGDRQGRAGDV